MDFGSIIPNPRGMGNNNSKFARMQINSYCQKSWFSCNNSNFVIRNKILKRIGKTEFEAKPGLTTKVAFFITGTGDTGTGIGSGSGVGGIGLGRQCAVD